jgi:hypothetical protein
MAMDLMTPEFMSEGKQQQVMEPYTDEQKPIDPYADAAPAFAAASPAEQVRDPYASDDVMAPSFDSAAGSAAGAFAHMVDNDEDAAVADAPVGGSGGGSQIMNPYEDGVMDPYLDAKLDS